MGGARHGPDFFNLHRNKRSITLDLKKPDGVAVLKKMAADADVLIENYRPDVKRRLGFDYETLRAINPRLVYVSLSGFGQDGPLRQPAGLRPDRAGHGRPDVGHRPCPARDLCASASPSPICQAATTRRWARSSLCWSGTYRARASGCRPRCCRRRSRCSTSRPRAGRWQARCRARPATIIRPASRPACSRPGRAHQHRRVGPAHLRRACCKALGAESCSRIPDFATGEKRSENRKRLNAELGEYTRRYGSLELVEKLNAAGVPSGPIYSRRPGLRRSAGAARRHGCADAAPDPRTGGGRQPGDGAVAHALRDRPPDARARRAHRRGSGRPRLQQGRDRRPAQPQG